MVGRLQQRKLLLGGISQRPSVETRKQVEEVATRDALSAFSQRASVIASALGRSWKIKQLSVNQLVTVFPAGSRCYTIDLVGSVGSNKEVALGSIPAAVMQELGGSDGRRLQVFDVGIIDQQDLTGFLDVHHPFRLDERGNAAACLATCGRQELR